MMPTTPIYNQLKGYTYWRILFEDGNFPSNYLGVSEIEMMTEAWGPSVCTGGTATSSLSIPQAQIDEVFDGTILSGANGYAEPLPTFPIWYAYEFASPVRIAQHRISRYEDITNSTPKDWKLQKSNDGVTWEDHQTVSNITDWGASGTRRVGWVESSPATVGKRYWRIRFTAKDDTGVQYNMSEFDFTKNGRGYGGYRPVSAKDEQTSFNHERLFDLDNSSQWKSSGLDVDNWVKVDMGENNAVNFDGYTFRSHTAIGGAPIAWVIESSDDNITWTTESTEAGISWSYPELKSFTI